MTATSGWRGNGGEPAGGGLRHIVWRTAEAVALPGGIVHASGDAWPQVRSPERLADVGDLAAQISHIQAVVVEGLVGVLVGMEPAVADLNARRDEIASLALVAANGKLAAVGVALLDLRITELNCDEG
jgi:hypothetical protein